MTPAQKQWSAEFTTEFINLYRSYPCLWKIKSKEYMNKFKKDDALQNLAEFCKTVYEDANIDFVKARINSLRGSFRKELKKVVASKKSGASADDVYVPKLWYYNFLTFTSDQETPRQSTSNIQNKEINLEGFESNKENNDSTSITDDVLTLTEISGNQPATSILKRKGEKMPDIVAKKRILLDKAEKLIDGDEYSSFGVVVAAKLRKMEERQRLYCEKIINDALFKGLLNELTPNSEIRNNNQMQNNQIQNNQQWYPDCSSFRPSTSSEQNLRQYYSHGNGNGTNYQTPAVDNCSSPMTSSIVEGVEHYPS